ANGVFEAKQVKLVDVFVEQAGVVGVAARVRDAFVPTADAAIGSDHGVGMLEESAHVVFADAVENGVGAAMGLDGENQIDLGVEGIRAGNFLGGGGNAQAVKGAVMFVVGEHDVGVVGAFALAESRFHFGDNALFFCGVGQAVGEFVAFAGAFRDELGEASAR